MDRDRALDLLKDHAATLRERGVVRLAVFGSTVRDDAGPESDVDVLVDIDRRRRFSLLDQAGLESYLSDALGRPTEVVLRDNLKPFLKDAILDEAVEVFPEFGRRETRSGDVVMPLRSPRQRLQDMMEAIDAIADFIAGKTRDDYRAERILRSAVERSVEIVSEASRHLPDDLKSAHPDVPWKEIAGIGNILRHGYDLVDSDVIWTVATRDLAPLRDAVAAMIREADQQERR